MKLKYFFTIAIILLMAWLNIKPTCAAGGSCAAENAIYITCESGTDISDEVQDAVNTLRASGGGTIYLPTGDFLFNTTVGNTSSKVMPGGINIIGRGVGKTILHSDGSMFFDINHWGQYSDGFRISGISFYGAPNRGGGEYTKTGISISNVVDFRIDHCYFERILYNIGVRSPEGYPQARGVVDHNTFNAMDLSSAYGVSDTRVWTSDLSLGTSEAVFIEDCHFTGFGHAGASFDGGRYVLRHSTIVDSASIDAHGPGFGCCARGARTTEIYENEIYRNPSNHGWTAVGLRAGGGVIFNNTFKNYDHAVRFSVDTYGYNATGGVYPTLDQVTDMWIWDNTLIDIVYDPNDPNYQDDTSNVNRSTVSGVLLYSNEAGRLIQKDRDFHMRAPSLAQDGFTYTPYIYPHPLTWEVDLHGRAADRVIDMDWTTNIAQFIDSWEITYTGTSGTPPSPITAIISSTRTYSLTNLANYESYTITLNAMSGNTPILTGTACLFPTDIFVYLPLVTKE